MKTKMTVILALGLALATTIQSTPASAVVAGWCAQQESELHKLEDLIRRLSDAAWPQSSKRAADACRTYQGKKKTFETSLNYCGSFDVPNDIRVICGM
jgi:hypothetical protein